MAEEKEKEGEVAGNNDFPDSGITLLIIYSYLVTVMNKYHSISH